MTNEEVRAIINVELNKLGYAKTGSISNKAACKILGLMPENVIGIGTVNGRKLLKAWIEGRNLTYEELGGMLRDAPLIKRRAAINSSISKQSKKVLQATWKKKDGFYDGREWRETRYMALQLCGAKCQCCGRSRADGVILHVDHIKPRSLHPELQLVLNNLQVLCEDCNLGKSNKDDTDWREVSSVAA